MLIEMYIYTSHRNRASTDAQRLCVQDKDRMQQRMLVNSHIPKNACYAMSMKPDRPFREYLYTCLYFIGHVDTALLTDVCNFACWVRLAQFARDCVCWICFWEPFFFTQFPQVSVVSGVCGLRGLTISGFPHLGLSGASGFLACLWFILQISGDARRFRVLPGVRVLGFPGFRACLVLRRPLFWGSAFLCHAFES